MNSKSKPSPARNSVSPQAKTSSTLAEKTKPASSPRHVELRDWLDAHHAVHMWQAKIKAIGLLDAYVVNGRIVIVQTFADHNGWEIYTPASNSILIDEALRAVEKDCGLVTAAPTETSGKTDIEGRDN